MTGASAVARRGYLHPIRPVDADKPYSPAVVTNIIGTSTGRTPSSGRGPCAIQRFPNSSAGTGRPR